MKKAFRFGLTPVITINNYEKAIELFVKEGDSFVDREPFSSYQESLNGEKGVFGVFETSGPLWLEQRRFAIRVLRDFGLGKNTMQDRILEEIETLFAIIDNDVKMGFKEHDLYMHTDIAIGSVINAVLNGFRFTANGNQARFYKMKKSSTEAMHLFSDPCVLIALNHKSFINLPFINSKFMRFVHVMKELHGSLNEIVDIHIDQLKDQEENDVEPRDFVDAYILEMKKCQKSNGPHYFSRTQLTNLVSDLWFAGQETTSTTLTWAIAYLIENIDVQTKLHEELDRVIGSERLIAVTDKQNLPYANAIIMESQRLANIIGQNFFRQASKDITVDGITIRKGMSAVVQISVLAIDPENFEDPKKFNPSRFIDENGKLKRCDALMPFSLGKRVCLGQNLAQMELFLFTANLFNRYKILAAEKHPTFLKVGGGNGLEIEPYKCRIEHRLLM